MLLLPFLFLSMSLAQAPSLADFEVQVRTPFKFAAYGDIRFTDPTSTSVTRKSIRRALIQAIADAEPAFISIGGDIASKGAKDEDWNVFDSETAVWRARRIPVFPALGNHDLRGNRRRALANYFEHFPELHGSHYYSVRASNVLVLVLDSSLAEVSGPQGDWLRDTLSRVPQNIEFVLIVLHHPPITSSSKRHFWAGHSVRPEEKALARMLEQLQQNSRARFVVFSGHVHNYERHEHGGVMYFVTGGGGAHPYTVKRHGGDPLAGNKVNYHYLLCKVDQGTMTVTMNRLDWSHGHASWTQPDSLRIDVPAFKAANRKSAR